MLPTFSKRRLLLQFALLAVLVLVVFHQVLNGAILLWDDRQLLLQDPLLRDLSVENFFALWGRVYESLYIPLVQSFWFLSGLLTGQWDSSALHALNLIFHVANACLVFAIIRELTPFGRDSKSWAAIAATLFFALHPTKVEPVAWVAGLKEVLAATAGMGSLFLYLRAKTDLRLRVLSVLLLALSLTAKPSFVILPLCLFILEWKRGTEVALLKKLSPYFALSAAITALSIGAQEPHALLYVPPWWGKLIVAVDALGFYVVKLVAPFSVAPDYGRMPGWISAEPTVWGPYAAAVAVVAGFVLWFRSKDLTRLVLLFTVSVLPVLGLFPFYFQQTSTVADRYLYFPSLWAAVGLALLLSSLANRRLMPALAASVAIYIGALALISYDVVPKWREDRVFFEWMLDQNKHSFTAYNRLGDLEREAGRHEIALNLYGISRGIAPWQPYPWLYSAFMQYELGRRQEAVATLEALVARYPQYEAAQENLRRLRGQ